MHSRRARKKMTSVSRQNCRVCDGSAKITALATNFTICVVKLYFEYFLPGNTTFSQNTISPTQFGRTLIDPFEIPFSPMNAGLPHRQRNLCISMSYYHDHGGVNIAISASSMSNTCLAASAFREQAGVKTNLHVQKIEKTSLVAKNMSTT